MKNEATGFGRQNSTAGKGIAQTVQTVFDSSSLHEQPQLAGNNFNSATISDHLNLACECSMSSVYTAKTQMLDDGSGVKEVFKVHNFELVPVAEEHQGSFFEHDCYLIRYTATGPKEHILVYYWLVRVSNI